MRIREPREEASSAGLDARAGFMLSGVASVLAIAIVSPQLDAATLAVVAAFLAASLAALWPRSTIGHQLGHSAARRLLTFAVIAAAALNGLQAWTLHPLLPAAWLLIALLSVAALHAIPSRAVVYFVAATAVFAVAAGIALALRPLSVIDVYQFQQEASAALLAGENPYSLRFLNIYGPGTPYYSPEVIDGDRVTFGFPYLPAGLLLAAPGFAVAGDFRWAALAAVIAAAVLIGMARRHDLGLGAALVMLISPTTQEVLWRGWSEPFAAVALAAVVWLAVRSALGTAIALGLFVAMKQYLAPALLLGLVALAHVRRELGATRMAITSVAVAAVTIVPFALWDLGSFVYSTITFHGLQPFRDDALSIPALAARNGLPYTESGFLGLAAGAVVLVLSLLRSSRTVTGFCAGLTLFLLAFFLFGKQAFINYYFLAMVAAASGVGALGLSRSRSDGHDAL